MKASRISILRNQLFCTGSCRPANPTGCWFPDEVSPQGAWWCLCESGDHEDSQTASLSLLTLRGSDASTCKTVGHRTSIFKSNEIARIGGCRPCACKIRHLDDFQCDLQESKKKSTVLQTKYGAFCFGGDYRDRTGDLLHAMQALSQLS